MELEERHEGQLFFSFFFGARFPLARRPGASPFLTSALFLSSSAKMQEAGAREGRGRSPGVWKVGLTGAWSFQAGFFFFFFCGRHRRLTAESSRPSPSRLTRSQASIPSFFDQGNQTLSFLRGGEGCRITIGGERREECRGVFFLGAQRAAERRESVRFFRTLSPFLFFNLTSLEFYLLFGLSE